MQIWRDQAGSERLTPGRWEPDRGCIVSMKQPLIQTATCAVFVLGRTWLKCTHERSRATMESAAVQRALEAARSTASALGLRADEGVVLHNSNRIAVRLTPCAVLARVAPLTHQAGAAFEVE